MNLLKTLLLSTCLLLASLGSAQTTASTVAFDFGGVLTSEPDRQQVVRFLRESFNLSEQKFYAVNALKKEAIHEGKTDEEFWLSYAKEKAIALPKEWPAAFKQVMKDAIGLNPAMTDLVFELKDKQVPVALLSNIDTRLAHFIRGFGMYEPFEPCLLSCEIGVRKPDPRAYEILLERIGAPAASVVFIDDRIENIEQAKKMGIDAILFESPEQIRRELTERGFL